MNINQSTLAARLREARTKATLTQEQVATALSVPRTAIVQIEAGKRSVSTLELAHFAQLYGRTIASFFEEPQHPEEADPLVSLFRAANVEGQDMAWKSKVSRYLGIFRAGVELERLLDRPPHVGPPTYDYPHPRKVMEAVEQGNLVAEQERRRLGLGHNPISDMSDLINAQNMWASGADLPDDVSGLFLKHSSIGLCILVKYDHPRARKRFSYAHEYAHALLDRQQPVTISRPQDRNDLGEVRAKAFAAAFLLPRSGVWAFLNARFKGGPSIVNQPVYDPSEQHTGEVRGQRREAPGSQALTYEDVAAVAHHFAVSYQAALFRIKSMGIVNEPEFAELRDKEHFGRSYLQVLEGFGDIGGKDEINQKPDREIVGQVLHLAIEAYRREEISQGKIRDLSSLLGIPAKDLLELAEAA